MTASRSLRTSRSTLPWLWLALGCLAFWAYSRAGLSLLHYDSRAHLVVARRVLDSQTPGLRQFGIHWLPLPHLLGFLPVRSDFLYRTGLASSLISLAAWWGFLIRLQQLLAELGLPRGAVRAGCSVAALHPGLLYLAGTPMTEPLFFFLLTSSALHLRRAIAGVGRRTGAEGEPRDLEDPAASPLRADDNGRPGVAEAWKGGAWMALACLTRYEAWGATLAGSLAAAISAPAGSRPLASTRIEHRRQAAAFAACPIAALAGFLMYAAWSTGSADFLRGVDAHRFPLPASLSRALLLGAAGLLLQFGWLGLAALPALTPALWFRRDPPCRVVAAVLAAPPLWAIASQWAGLGFRPRYLLSALPLFAAAWAAFAGRLRPLAGSAATAAVVLQGFVPFFPVPQPLAAASGLLPGFEGSATERIARRLARSCPSHLLEPRPRALLFPWPDHAVLFEACATDLGREVDFQVARALLREDDGAPVLAPMADLAGWMHATGLPLRRFIHEGNWPEYAEALGEPRAHAGWVAVRIGSPLERRLAPRLRRDGGFVRLLRVADPCGYGVVLFRRVSLPALVGLTPRGVLTYPTGVSTERIERFRKFLASDPGNLLIRFSLSEAYFDAGRLAEAIAEFRRVIEGKPDWMLAHILLGRSLIDTGQPQEARRVLERALELARQQGHAGPMAEIGDILSTLPSSG